MKQHIHHDCIVAWAKGAEIQFQDQLNKDKWHDSKIPMWYETGIYRIKPAPIIHNATFNLYINSVEPIAIAFEERGVGKVHPSYKVIGKINLTTQDKEIINYTVDITKGTTI